VCDRLNIFHFKKWLVAQEWKKSCVTANFFHFRVKKSEKFCVWPRPDRGLTSRSYHFIIEGKKRSYQRFWTGAWPDQRADTFKNQHRSNPGMHTLMCTAWWKLGLWHQCELIKIVDGAYAGRGTCKERELFEALYTLRNQFCCFTISNFNSYREWLHARWTKIRPTRLSRMDTSKRGDSHEPKSEVFDAPPSIV